MGFLKWWASLSNNIKEMLIVIIFFSTLLGSIYIYIHTNVERINYIQEVSK